MNRNARQKCRRNGKRSHYFDLRFQKLPNSSTRNVCSRISNCRHNLLSTGVEFLVQNWLHNKCQRKTPLRRNTPNTTKERKSKYYYIKELTLTSTQTNQSKSGKLLHFEMRDEEGPRIHSYEGLVSLAEISQELSVFRVTQTSVTDIDRIFGVRILNFQNCTGKEVTVTIKLSGWDP